MDKTSYLSDGWFAVLANAARNAIQDSALKGQARDFTLLERYAGGPVSVGETGMQPGFLISFSHTGDASVRPGAGRDEVADCVLDLDWQGACQLVSQLSGPDLDRLLQDLCATGRATIAGDIQACPVDLNSFHDAMVRATFIDA
jgi:hypothetical protein